MIPHDDSLGDPGDLAALYAAGALTGPEYEAFEAHLVAGCAICVAEVEAYGPAVAALAEAAPPRAPGGHVRAALLRRVAEAGPGASPLRELVLAELADTTAETIIRTPAQGPWQETSVPGVQLRVLAVDRVRNQFTALARMAPGAAYPRHVHSAPEDCLVLEGELLVGGEVMRAGDYQRAPAGSAHGVQRTETGCLLFITSSLTDEFV